MGSPFSSPCPALNVCRLLMMAVLITWGDISVYFWFSFNTSDIENFYVCFKSLCEKLTHWNWLFKSFPVSNSYAVTSPKTILEGRNHLQAHRPCKVVSAHQYQFLAVVSRIGHRVGGCLYCLSGHRSTRSGGKVIFLARNGERKMSEHAVRGRVSLFLDY